MNRIIFLLLVFASLACGLLENGTPTSQHIIQTSTPSSTPSPTPCLVRTGIEDGGLLNLREGPGMNYAPVRVLHEGEVILLANAPAYDGWQSVKADSIDGWVNKNYIDCTLSTNASASTPKTNTNTNEVKR